MKNIFGMKLQTHENKRATGRIKRAIEARSGTRVPGATSASTHTRAGVGRACVCVAKTLYKLGPFFFFLTSSLPTQLSLFSLLVALRLPRLNPAPIRSYLPPNPRYGLRGRISLLFQSRCGANPCKFTQFQACMGPRADGSSDIPLLGFAGICHVLTSG